MQNNGSKPLSIQEKSLSLYSIQKVISLSK
nr:MAG TPA: hypothetical protein [Caudoviricetes sp.]